MKDHEFYAQYANTPLAWRDEHLGFAFREFGSDVQQMSMSRVYAEIHAIDDKIRGDIIRKERLLQVAQKWFRSAHN